MKNKKLKKSALLLAGCLLLPVFPGQSQGACSRSDVDYYLEKGFTHEQIADICRGPVQEKEPIRQDNGSKTEVTTDDPLSPDQSSETPTKTRPQSKSGYPGTPEKFLAESIDGYDIDITGDYLKYTRERCLEYGEEDLFGFKGKVCPEILYTIDLRGMKVLSSEKEYLFFGDERVKVEGEISRQIIGGLEELPEKERELVTETVQEDGDQLIIPIREGVPVKRVIDNLEKLGR
ncbi:MAG: hypothetical protein ACLFV2_00905 [Desulfurivibrionaceae bacterium]